ncbi:unnamed protein product [Fusarium graminearum]|nr:unnamed protein product [Fusarium graminearum]VTO92096.1 unnamed protein product [Fusarium graminearum]
MLPHVCVYPARGFCRFRFQIDDMVIVHDPNKLSNPIPGFHLHRYSEKNRSILLFGLSAYKAYHFSCVEFALPNWSQPGYRLDRDIWGATIQESIWETSLPSTERLRADWLIERFAHRMVYVVPYSKFPLKILRKIGRDFLREEAVMELKHLWLQKKKDPTDILIDVDETSTLWIRYIHIEGLKAILIIPEFHHLDIEFSPSGRILHQTRFCDLIWSTIPKPLAIFPSPGSPGEHVRIDRNQNDGQQLSNIVQHIDFNKPGTSGYSFCGYRDNLIEIIPNDNESLPFDVAHAEGGLFPLWWMYLSLDEGERISELWERIYSTGTQW